MLARVRVISHGAWSGATGVPWKIEAEARRPARITRVPCPARGGSLLRLVRPVAVLGQILAGALFLVALLVALDAVAVEDVEQQQGQAGADAHGPAVPSELV